MKRTPDELEFATTALLVALSARNLETGNHCPRVCRIALQLGRELQLSGDDLYNLKFGALLHDVGKMKTPDAVLCKPDRLTEDEWAIMRRHPFDGACMLRGLEFPEAVCLIVEQHHERWDGVGYPFGLTTTQIRSETRIFAVADAYDALTRDRVYRKGIDHHGALSEISAWSGIQFDPRVVETLSNIPRNEL